MPVTVKNEDFIDQIEKLPPLADIVQQILSITRSQTASAGDIAKVLSGDPTIVAKILRVANSPFYGSGREVTQLSRAVVTLGMVAIRNLVMGICSRDALSTTETQAPEHALVWRHSIAVASACDLIARQVGFKPPEEAFLCGLLHDIGHLAMVTFRPQDFRAVLQEQDPKSSFLELERSYLGMDHTEAGSRILAKWGLPESLCSAVQHHHIHEPNEQDDHARLLAITMLGDVMAYMIGIGFDLHVGILARARAASTLLDLSDSQQMQILCGLDRRIAEATEMLASTDSANSESEQPVSKRAIWASQSGDVQYGLGQLLLEHHGYDVLHASLEELSDTLSQDDLVLIDLQQSDDAAASRLARVLTEQGFERIAVLSTESEGRAIRQCDPDTGVCHVPRLFTAFDLNWIEEQLQP